ncbi:hypothetical protein WJX77_003222 [Trebouxia sp. C0004]
MKPGIKSGQCCERGGAAHGSTGRILMLTFMPVAGHLVMMKGNGLLGEHSIQGFADDLQLASNVHKGVASLAMYCLPHWQLV